MKANLHATSGCLVAIYALAAPIYLVRFLFKTLKLFRLWRIFRLGYIDCPHCGAENAIDILTTCPRCKITEYGNRLECTGCGTLGSAFPCDVCGVTIRCL